MIILNLNSILEARFELDLEEPVLMYIQKNHNSSQYRGPQNVQDLLSFIDDQTRVGQFDTKVLFLLNSL